MGLPVLGRGVRIGGERREQLGNRVNNVWPTCARRRLGPRRARLLALVTDGRSVADSVTGLGVCGRERPTESSTEQGD